MKTSNQLLGKVLSILAELQSGTASEFVQQKLVTQLEMLYYYILDDEDIPEEYWEQIEKWV